jgi:DNA-binding GntR family transcriptional regulator
LRDDADTIVRAVIEAAKGGDPTAMRLCVERLIPVRKGRPTEFNLPPVETASDITKALGVIAGQMAEGAISPEEAEIVARVIELQRRAIETVDHEERLKKIEAGMPK